MPKKGDLSNKEIKKDDVKLTIVTINSFMDQQ